MTRTPLFFRTPFLALIFLPQTRTPFLSLIFLPQTRTPFLTLIFLPQTRTPFICSSANWAPSGVSNSTNANPLCFYKYINNKTYYTIHILTSSSASRYPLEFKNTFKNSNFEKKNQKQFFWLLSRVPMGFIKKISRVAWPA